MTLPALASADVSTRISRSSTRSVVVAYVSMTCTPFRSSIDATREARDVPQDIPFANEGSPDLPFVLLAPSPSRGDCTHGVLMAPWLTRDRCGMALSDVLGRVEADAEKALETLKEYCRFPTISAHKRAQPETAAFVRRLLAENGFESREYPTEGGPNVVFGQMIVDERKPTLMMYQHYDVQPVDPLNEWKRDPFDPTIQDGKFWGRGCGDTKGNLIMQLLATQAWRAVEGRPPINLKFVVEGEEEVGSPHFASFVHANKEILKADGATIEGGDHLHEGTPKIELGCKGILYVEMVSRTASVDQHSSYAAIAPNPAWRLMHALMSLRDAKGRIKIAGWYEDARRPTARELRFLKSSVFSSEALKGFWGVKEFIGGDNDFELVKHLIYSPTCTICGFVSGYIEQGTKTVNPAVVKAAIKGSVDAYGREPEVWPWSIGASAHGFFNEVVGVPSISGPGVSYDGSNYHAPNEHFRIEDFVGGAKHMAAMMSRL